MMLTVRAEQLVVVSEGVASPPLSPLAVGVFLHRGMLHECNVTWNHYDKLVNQDEEVWCTVVVLENFLCRDVIASMHCQTIAAITSIVEGFQGEEYSICFKISTKLILV